MVKFQLARVRHYGAFGLVAAIVMAAVAVPTCAAVGSVALVVGLAIGVDVAILVPASLVLSLPLAAFIAWRLLRDIATPDG